MGRPQTARHGMRAAGSSAAPHPGDSERRHICAMRETRRWLGVGCRSWHVAPRARAEEKWPLDGAVRFGTTRDDNNQRGTARAFSKLECCASSLVTTSAEMPAPHDMRRWLGVGGCSWHVTPRARTVGERPLTGAVSFYRARADHNQRGTARAQQQARVLRPISSDSERRDTQRWLGIGGRSWHVTPRARIEGERPLAGAVSLSGVSRPHPARRGARAQHARVLRHIPATASASAAAPLETQNDGFALEGAAGTSHHKRAPKERGLWTAQCALVPRGTTTTSAARRERSASSSAAPHP